ncbi:MAG: ROK family protein [Anaerolineae bacterium]|nr:ROK family protein [Anaerolineae bacterium]
MPEVAERKLCLALDFGGTKLAAGIVDWRSGRVVREARQRTGEASGAEGQIADMLALVDGLLGAMPEGETLTGVGVSFGGPVDAPSGTVLQSHHVPGWDGLPLASRLSRRLGLPVLVENDANAVALGELLYGAGRGVADLVYMTISTGIGGGIILDGQLWRGHHGVAGEVGHMVVRPDGPVCTCGNRGCLEALASGLSIARRAREALAAGRPGELLLALAGGEPDGITAELVFRAALSGDDAAKSVVAEAAADLGLAIAMLCSIIDPARVILGGGVAKAGEQLLVPVRQAFRRHAFPLLVERVSIVRAAAIDQGGLLGAAALVARMPPSAP